MKFLQTIYLLMLLAGISTPTSAQSPGAKFTFGKKSPRVKIVAKHPVTKVKVKVKLIAETIPDLAKKKAEKIFALETAGYVIIRDKEKIPSTLTSVNVGVSGKVLDGEFLKSKILKIDTSGKPAGKTKKVVRPKK